ncbi:hypothetical protein AB4Z48_35655 [Cupriavidus sp. 2TAF22]|uniref:hypothetical protein n=1 Tax=unclassified Cupriavidus TaxID=2640874 RepID=UPI003F928069
MSQGIGTANNRYSDCGADEGNRDRHRRRIDEWLLAVAKGNTSCGYDDWLQRTIDDQHRAKHPHGDQRAMSPMSKLLRQGDIVFQLEHGARYEVRHDKEGTRVFVCMFDDETPYIAFEDTRSGIRFPWITVQGVFRQSELRTIRKL